MSGIGAGETKEPLWVRQVSVYPIHCTNRKRPAEKEGVSMNWFIALATVEHMEERAERGDREKFDAIFKESPGRGAGGAWSDMKYGGGVRTKS